MTKKDTDPAEQREHAQPPRGRRWRLAALGCLFLILGGMVVGIWMNAANNTLPGSNLISPLVNCRPEAVNLHVDITGVSETGERVTDQQTFDALLAVLDRADGLIVLDMFLVNEYYGDSDGMRNITAELVAKLVSKKRAAPETFILFVTDPINSFYTTDCPAALVPLVEVGGNVVLTDLAQLRDSNHIYSPLYRSFGAVLRFLPGVRRGLLANPFAKEGADMSLVQVGRLLNFKANHRKVAIVADAEGVLHTWLGSGNPHTASSAHGNIAVTVTGGPAAALLASEYRIALASALRDPGRCHGRLTALELARELELRLADLQPPSSAAVASAGEAAGQVGVQVLTEGWIGARADTLIAAAGPGDRLDMMMFYLSDPAVLDGLRKALLRGASVRLLLDPNKDAFGRRKSGVPNRIAATALKRWAARRPGTDLAIRWFATHGEQAHFKSLRLTRPGPGAEKLLIGSANFTVRNLRDYNLEASIYLENSDAVGQQVGDAFETLWENKGAITYSAPFEEYEARGGAYIIGKICRFLGDYPGLSTY